MSKLVIVESPAKAKTIEKYLGKDYIVKASIGHVRDLPKSNVKAIDIDGGFVPHYEISKDKGKIIAELKKFAAKSSEVILATDPDREGEAIAWHLSEVLNLKDPKRVAFHEITEAAVKRAIENPRHIDTNLRRAQEARRVLDRLVGYDLSGLIWKKVRYGLSAGRVQSPALRILAEREREIRAFIPEAYWQVRAETKTDRGASVSLSYSEEPRQEVEADRVVNATQKGRLVVQDVEEKEVSRKPRPPFTTSTLQQAASSRLGFSPSRTMRTAQRLYESGHITYMRTDSTAIAKVAIQEISLVVTKKFGAENLCVRVFKTKSKSAQEAHEAIRPTKVTLAGAGSSDDQKKLYGLIWSRTIASQMADAKMMRTKINVRVEGADVISPFGASGSRLLSEGWLLADQRAKGEDVILPKLTEGDELSLVSVEKEGKETEPPSRYSEAGLIKELEKRGIGRPSTYASILATIEARKYVEKENKSLRPTEMGMVISGFLEDNFSQYISDSFTSEMEEKLDDIALGNGEYQKTLRDFYGPFYAAVQDKQNLPKLTTLGDAPPEMVCPTCAASMVLKLGKSGTFYSCSLYPACDGARTMEGTAMEGPKEIGRSCPKCAGPLVERIGKYGKFISCGTYPKCKYIEEDAEEKKRRSTGITCPQCKKGDMGERRGRFGIFFSCSDYPTCKYAIKARPTGKLCETCGALMMQGTKTIPDRCSDKNCANHNPHKIKPTT